MFSELRLWHPAILVASHSSSAAVWDCRACWDGSPPRNSPPSAPSGAWETGESHGGGFWVPRPPVFDGYFDWKYAAWYDEHDVGCWGETGRYDLHHWILAKLLGLPYVQTKNTILRLGHDIKFRPNRSGEPDTKSLWWLRICSSWKFGCGEHRFKFLCHESPTTLQQPKIYGIAFHRNWFSNLKCYLPCTMYSLFFTLRPTFDCSELWMPSPQSLRDSRISSDWSVGPQPFKRGVAAIRALSQWMNWDVEWSSS